MTGDRERRREALAGFYRAHHRTLSARVARDVRSPDRTVAADACAYAWLQLVRRPDVDLTARGALAWLRLVAIQEAWRLKARREQPAGLHLADRSDERPDGHPDERPEPAGEAVDPLERAIAAEAHHDRLVRFAALKPRERRDLLLHAAGYRYREIAHLTASTYTAVDRRLKEGRAALKPSR